MKMGSLVDYIAENFLEQAQPQGENEINALCPFHSETKGSFFINRVSGKWYCWGQCAMGGGIHSLARKLKIPMSFLKDLEKDLPRQKPKKKEKECELPYGLLGLFDYCPTKLIEDGFSEEILKSHNIGFDTRFNRITFPVFCGKHKLRLISGRTVIDEDPKYLIYKNKHLKDLSMESLEDYYPHKEYYFFREDKIKPGMDIVLCEGFKAALWLAQHGYNSIASMGITVPTNSIFQAKISNLGIDTLFVMYDNNEAGILNSLNAARNMIHFCKKVRFAQYPSLYEDLQPDDLTSEELADAFNNALTMFKWKEQVKNDPKFKEQIKKKTKAFQAHLKVVEANQRKISSFTPYSG